jgi:hypothetical protein
MLTLTDKDRMTRTCWTRASTVSAGPAEPAAIVLACADGTGTSETARRLRVSRPTVIKWRDRFDEHGVAWLHDEPRSGRPKSVDEAAIIADHTGPAARAPGGDALVDPAPGEAARHRRRDGRAGLAPLPRAAVATADVPVLHRPAARGKVPDVVGLYLDPPEKAIVLCVDEKGQIQALDWTPRSCPCIPGCRRWRPTTTSGTGRPICSPALEVATGKGTNRCYERHGKAEFLDFLKRVARAYSRRELHGVLGNYRTHKHDNITAWLASHPGDAPLHADLRLVA